MLGIVDTCSHCDLVLKHHDAADGPTFFSLVVVGFLVIALAAFVEMRFEPALWIHAALWIPFTFIASIVCLRVFKTILITIEHRLALLKENNPYD